MIKARVRPQKPYLDDNNYWYVTRHADCKIVLSEGNSSKDFSHVDLDNIPVKGWIDSHLYNQSQKRIRGEAAVQLFITEDEPERSQVTRVIHNAFNTERLQIISNSFESKMRELLDNSLNNNFDMINDLINILTEEYVMSIINVPEFNEFKSEMVDACRKGLYFYFGLGEHIEPLYDKVKEDYEKATKTLADLMSHSVFDYFINPREESNLLSSLIPIFKDNLYLVAFNIVSVIITSLGLESALCGLTATILQDKELLNRLKNEEKILPSHMDELYRVSFYKPLLHRVLERDITIDDIVMKKGMIVTVDVTSAGFDPEVFPMPYEVDFSRPIKNTISYSYGLHNCLGRVISRNLGALYINILLEKVPDIKLTGDIQFLMVSQLVEPSYIPVQLRVDTQTDLV